MSRRRRPARKSRRAGRSESPGTRERVDHCVQCCLRGDALGSLVPPLRQAPRPGRSTQPLVRTLASGRRQPGHLPRPATGLGGGPRPARVGTQAGVLVSSARPRAQAWSGSPCSGGGARASPAPLSGPLPWEWPPRRSAPMSGWSWSPRQSAVRREGGWEGPGIGDTGTVLLGCHGHHVWSIQRAQGSVFKFLFHPRRQATKSPRCGAPCAGGSWGPAEAPGDRPIFPCSVVVF